MKGNAKRGIVVATKNSMAEFLVRVGDEVVWHTGFDAWQIIALYRYGVLIHDSHIEVVPFPETREEKQALLMVYPYLEKSL